MVADCEQFFHLEISIQNLVWLGGTNSNVVFTFLESTTLNQSWAAGTILSVLAALTTNVGPLLNSNTVWVPPFWMVKVWTTVPPAKSRTPILYSQPPEDHTM